MADRPNDTDPQSPRALAFRTDPGLGGSPAVLGPRVTPANGVRMPDLSPPPPAVPTPSPGSASIEALLDGITGPRPPPAKRDVAPGSTRAYAAARLAPASQMSQKTRVQEPLVVSPEPSSVAEGNAGSEASPKLDPASTRPVARRTGQERTVYTGRRAVLRNLAAVAGSSVVVGLALLTVMRWNEAGRARRAAAGIAPPPVLAVSSSPPSVDPPVVSASEPAGEVPAAITTAAPTAPLMPSSAASAPKPAASVAKHPKAQSKPSAPANDSLDDLNRQIRH
jgi:hypothetical protein